MSKCCKMVASQQLLSALLEPLHMLAHVVFQVVGHFSGKIWHKCLLTPDRKPVTDQNNDAAEVQFDELTNWFGLPTGMWVRSSLKEQGPLRGSCMTESPPQDEWQLGNPSGAFEVSAFTSWWVRASFPKPGLSASSADLTGYTILGNMHLVPCVSGQFQGLPKTCKLVYFLIFNEPPCRTSRVWVNFPPGWYASTRRIFIISSSLSVK